jgi:hypothetical protein
MRRTNRIAATVVGAVLAAGAALVGAGSTPAWALAVCPTDHVCFYQDFHDNGGTLSFAGTMSDQNNALIDHPTTVFAAWTDANVGADGKISDFRNSHYTNGDGLNDSVSSIANNSNHCLFLLGDINFDIAINHAQEGVEMGPHSALALVGATFGDANDRLSSAYTVVPGSSSCDVGEHGFKLLDSGGGGE